MRITRSMTVRLTLLFAAASTAVLLVVGYVIGAAVEAHFVEQDREDLQARVELARRVLSRVTKASDLDGVPQQLDDAIAGQHGLAIAVVRRNGDVLFATSGAPFPRPMLQTGADAVRAPGLATWDADGHAYRGMAAAVPIALANESPATVAVALNIDHHRAFVRDFRRTLWIAIAAGALLMAALGFVAARRGLVPVQAMTRLTRGISTTHLADRVDLASLPRELVGLGSAFNEMLARLEDGVTRLSDFSSDIAHELRTPISTLMTQTQVALARSRPAEEYREALYGNLEELDRLARMIADMLFLAKSENGLMVPRNESFEIADEARQLFEFYDALAEERGVRLVLDGAARMRGDALMIRRALSNLISNALRHASPDAPIRVHIVETPSQITVAVENRGGTIPAEHRERIFDRFYRVDPARQRASEGAGLGLAITRAIVHAHGGEIAVESHASCTRFVLTFPASRVAPAAEESRPAESASR
jgi:two-component system heavy metal sensor histidine kinase CusS